MCQSCQTNIILLYKNFSIISDFLHLKPKSLIIFQRAHFPPLKLIFFLSAGNNDCEVGRSPSVVWNSLIVLRITHLSKSSLSVLIFLLASFLRVPNSFPTRLLCSYSFKCVSDYLRTHQ
jgi:hypothetical protein